MSNDLQRIAKKVQKLFTENLSPEGEPTPHAMREIARLITEARRDHFVGNDGLPDLKGSSWAYREFMRNEIFSNIDPRYKDRLRYFIGNALRDPEIIPPEMLKEAGLLKASPRERSKEINNGIAEVANLIKNKGRLDPDSSRTALKAIAALAQRINPELENDYPGLTQHLEEIQKLAGK